MDIDEILSSPAFWLLAIGGLAAEIIGWIVSRRAFENAFPLWQLLVVMGGTVVAAAFFAGRE